MTPLLMLVSDRATARLPLGQLAKEAVAGGVDLVQVRERSLTPLALATLVEEVISAVGRDRVAVNDAPGLAATLGVHLHLPERSTSGFVPSPGLRSLSCAVHSVDRMHYVPIGAAYVVAGHVFPTDSHPDAPPLGVGGLRAIVEAAPAPVVAIGGMAPETAADALSAGACGVAVLSYVNSSPTPGKAAREVRDALEHLMSQPTAVDMIALQVNGKAVELSRDATLSAFLVQRNLHPRLVVVERNREIVARSAYDSTVLVDGDVLEIAHFVGGG